MEDVEVFREKLQEIFETMKGNHTFDSSGESSARRNSHTGQNPSGALAGSAVRHCGQ